MNLYEKALELFPKLSRDLGYKENFGGGDGFLEFYPADEQDNPFPGKPSVQVFNPETRPEDVAGDIVSHHMIDNDPVIGEAYRRFLMSMRPFQQKILQDQYQHAVTNSGEQRPFEKWAEMTGQPGYFRGYTFGQWPAEFNKKAYTDDQRGLLNGVVNYLRGR